MTSEDRKEVWKDGVAYEQRVGRWSRQVAYQFVDWLGLARDRHWLDIGCGTGVLSRIIAERCAPKRVIGIDPSDGYLSHARAQVSDDKVEFQRVRAEALPFADGAFDAAVSGLVLNFLSDTGQALSEMARVVRPGGIVAGYVWDFAGEMQIMRRFWDAAVALDPAAVEIHDGLRFPLCKPRPLADLFTAAGLRGVETRAIDIPAMFRHFDDYWSPFLSGDGTISIYCMSLSERRRAALRDRIQASLPTRDDGSIPLIARAWAVRGAVAP